MFLQSLAGPANFNCAVKLVELRHASQYPYTKVVSEQREDDMIVKAEKTIAERLRILKPDGEDEVLCWHVKRHCMTDLLLKKTKI